MTAESGVLGPGTLKIGSTGTAIDASCLVNNAAIAMSKDESDATRKLCGDVRAGVITYTYALSGNVDTDIANTAGLFALSQSAAGTQQPFEFTPSTAKGTKATGTLVIDPLDFGGSEMGADLTSDFEWSIVGKPTYAYGTVAATGATAGTPGTWTPAGATPPANAAAATGITASPATAWTTGQYVQGSTAGSAGEMYWSGSAWTAGRKP